MDAEKILKSLRSNLKALVLTEKNGYTVSRLYGQYRELVGQDIREESRHLGFGSLEEFLDCQRDIMRRGYNNEGEQVYKGVADASTQHMATLVANTPAQRKKKKGSKSRGRGMRGSSGGMGGRGGFAGRGAMRVGLGRGGFAGRGAMRVGLGRGGFAGRGGMIGRGGSLPGGSGVPGLKKENYSYHKNALENYFVKNNLGEVPFKTLLTGTRFSATVLVNGKEFKTFPQTFGSEAEAVEVVSKRCVLYLYIQKDGSVMKENSDKVMLVYRIEKLVANKVNGVYSTFIQKQYEKLYKEQLPSRWWEKIKSMNVVRVEPLAPGSDVMLVYPASAGEDQDSNDNASTENVTNNDSSCNANRGKSEVKSQNSMEQEECQLPSLKPPNESEWNVYVTAVASAGEICLRFIGSDYSERFDAMSNDMDIFYSDSTIPPVHEFVQDRIYAANVSGGWHRVQVLNTDQVKTAVCLFIDDGDQDIVSIGDVKEINPTFLEVAGQAAYVSLQGLEDAIDDEDVTEELKGELVGKSLIALVIDAGNETDVPSVVLYDTSGELDVNINQMIINDWENTDDSEASSSSEADMTPITKSLGILDEELDIIQRNIDLKQDVIKPELIPTKMLKIAEVNRKMKPMKTLKIPQINTDMDVMVVWTSSPSNFLVQPLEHVTSLENLMDDLCHYYNNPSNQVTIASGVAMGDFFAVKNDKFWYRVRVTKLIDASWLVIRFVDFGEVQIVGVGDLQPLVETFRELPCLAVQAKLAGVGPISGEWNQGEIFWFNERVVGGQFVSRVKGVETSMEGENILVLELIDTSDPYEDKYVAEELLNWVPSFHGQS